MAYGKNQKKIEGWPYGWSLGFDKDGNIIYLNAQTRRVESFNKSTVWNTINPLIN